MGNLSFVNEATQRLGMFLAGCHHPDERTRQTRETEDKRQETRDKLQIGP